MISFIMMAKNEEERIGVAINSLISQNIYNDWELIIVDDFSSDQTLKISLRYSKFDERIKVYKNPYSGKVLGTNFGYTRSSGEYIKCIDADDVLAPLFFEKFKGLIPFEAHCHPALIVDEELKTKSIYRVNPKILNKPYEYVLENLISLPKWSWTIHRTIADQVFPINAKMPIEDIWIAVAIKHYAREIILTQEPLYLYRQHIGQDYGGILNYERALVVLRAQRSEKFIEVFENEHSELIYNADFSQVKESLRLQSGAKSVFQIIKSRVSLVNKFKIIAMVHFPNFAVKINLLKWKIDGYRDKFL
ncbi:glycosyltransferase [Rhodobacterales bacterium HKCCA1058]|nr:glycosyltransferase [Rhodobacterales bacterium HKCCA1058]